MKKLNVCILILLILIIQSTAVVGAGDFDSLLLSEDYSYNYDGKSIPSPKSYEVARIMPIDQYSSIVVDLCRVGEDKIAVLFADPAFVVVLDSNFKELAKIAEFKLNNQSSSFNKPEGIFADAAQNIYVTDTQNNRIVVINSSNTVSRIVHAPQKQEINSDLPFEPQKIAVDDIGDMFVVARNQTNGIMQFDKNGIFTGFLGATKVVPNVIELFWRSISTKEQRANSLKIIPTEYSNLCIDKSGFVYPIVSAVDTYEMYAAVQGRSAGNTPPIRKLNSLGNDVLIRAGSHSPMGDLEFNLNGKGAGASRFIDVCISESGNYSLLDINRNRIFGYDQRGNLMYIFGSSGDRDDQFKKPVAIESIGENILVIDEVGKSIKEFKPTNYQKKLESAIIGITTRESGIDVWQSILKEYPYNELAQFEIGKILLSQGKYEEAMHAFRLSHNKDYYSKALKLQSKEQGLKNADKILGSVLAAVLLIILLAVFSRKIKQDLSKYKVIAKFNNRHRKQINEITYCKHLITHPFDGFWDIKRENRGSTRTASFIIIATVVTNCLYRYTTPYLFQSDGFDKSNPVLLGLIQVIVPLLFWCVANWCVTSLFDGNGNFKDIYVYSAYSLIPLPFALVIMTVMGQFINLDQQPLYRIILPLTLMIVAFLLYAGTVATHEYSAGKALGAISLILVSIGIMVFILILVVTLSQQIIIFINDCTREITMRFQ